MEEQEKSEGGAEGSKRQAAAAARYEQILMQEAHSAMEKGEFEAAVSIFEDLLRRFRVALPEEQKNLIHSECGTLLYWLGDYERGKRHCEEALQFGDNDQAYEILGKIAVAQFHFPQARGFFSKISEDNPARSLGMCLVSIKLRETVAAGMFLDEARKRVAGTDPEWRAYNAYFLLLKGDAKIAVSHARELVRKLSRDPALILLLAEIFMMAGSFGEARATAEKVGAVCPENDGVSAIRAHAAYAEEKWDEAELQAQDAVSKNPRNFYAKTVLMKLAVRRGSYSLAEEIGTQVIHDAPEYSLGHANLGDVYFIDGRYELAEIEYDQTQHLMNADTKGARLRQARMKFIRGEYAASAEVLEKLIEGYHTYYDDAMCDLALCYDKMGDAEKKEEVLDKMAYRRSFYHRTEKILQKFEQ